MIPRDAVIRRVTDDAPEGWKPNTKLLYTLATTNGWSHAGVKNLIMLQFKKQSTKDLAFAEYNRVMDWLGSLPPDSTTTEADTNTLDMFP